MSAPQRGISGQPLVDIGADRLRIDAAEVGMRSVELADGEVAPIEQAAEPARARTPHRFDEDLPVGGPDPLEVYDARELIAEPQVGIEFFDQPAVDRIVVLASRWKLGLRIPLHRGFDGREHGRRRGAARCRPSP